MHRSLLALVLASIAFAACGRAEDGPATLRALKLMKIGKEDEAAALLEQALGASVEERERVSMLGLLGEIHLRGMRFEQALARFTELAKLRPEHPKAHFKRGEALMHRIATLGEAIQAFERAETKGEKSAELYANLAFCHKTLGDHHQEARADRYAEAVAQYRKALELDPANVRALGNLADLYFNIGATAEAIRLYEKMREAQPDSFLLQARLGHAYLAAGKPREAVDVLSQGLKEMDAREAPGDPREQILVAEARMEFLAYLGQAQEALGEKDAARTTWTRVLNLASEAHPAGEDETSLHREKARKLAAERLEALKEE